MKRLGLLALLLGLCINSFAFEINHAQLAQETKAMSGELGKLILLPKQTLECAGVLTKASSEVFTTSTLLRFKSLKLAKKGIEASMKTLLMTTGKNCVGQIKIIKAQADLLAIDMKL